MPTQVETFEFGESVQVAWAGLQEAAIAKGLAFQARFAPSQVTVRVNPIRIAQVLQNLVDNAVRYSPAAYVRRCCS
jgi:signal transduction histidine kinase